jgi:exosome complex exonuclease DIS3/RRP44
MGDALMDENVPMDDHLHVQHDDVEESDNDDESDDELIVEAPSLYKRSMFFRQTRKRGKIFKTVMEQYVRDDLGLGSYFVDDGANKTTRRVKDAVVGKPRDIQSTTQLLSLLQHDQDDDDDDDASNKTTSLVICDTNVLLHNLDVLEQAPIPNLVIPQTTLQECRANQLTAYDRTVELLRAVGGTTEKNKRLVLFFADQHHVATAHVKENTSSTTSKNDENDARIRLVAEFYGRQLKGSNVSVILLTDDAGSRAKALEESKNIYKAKSVRAYAQELEKKHPNLALSDLVANYGGSSTGQHQHNGATVAATKDYFPRHVDTTVLSRGVQSGTYHRGVYRSTADGMGRVTIRKGEERVAVTISEWNDRNRAVDGDVVAIALHPLEQWLSSAAATVEQSNTVGIASETAEPTHSELTNVSDFLSINDVDSLRPTGKVVGIIRRNFDHNYCGSIYSAGAVSAEREAIAKENESEHADGTTMCVFFAVDKKIPPILIRTTQRERLTGQRIEVAMDSWPITSPYPLGHYVRTLGEAGSKDVETEVLLQEHNIPHEPFPAKVLACLPPTDYKIEYTPERADLRHIPVLSIDPPGCKDIDDALHCTVLPNGNYQVGVHIADVTHYVKAGSAMDLEAANRSTSTYLVNRRLDMLPALLTTDLCSLKGNLDRYAFSVIWEVTPDADIVDVDFKKSIIHSVAALTYQQAQTLIDTPHDDKSDIKVGAVKRLASLARKFRKRRIDAGALTLASPEVKFVLDSESLNPTDVQAYQLFEANAVVEEFMLLANVTVSKKILRHYPTLSVLRRHAAPNRSMFQSLISKARSRGIDIDIEDSKKLADSLDLAVLESDPFFNKLMRMLSTRCMSPAQYFCSGEFKPTDWHHYGLAAPVYTHFTSPIRRYADVCVHRLLAAAIGVSPLPVHLSSKSYLHDLTTNMNRRHRAAQLAGRASVQLHTLIFFSGDGAKEEDAYVLDVETADKCEPSFNVFVPRYGIEGRIMLSDIAPNDPDLKRDADKHSISYKGISVQVFDKVRIKIFVKELEDHQRELVVNLLEPKFAVGKDDERATKKLRTN